MFFASLLADALVGGIRSFAGVAAGQLALLDGCKIGRVVAIAVVGFGLGGGVISEVKLSVSLYPDDFAVFCSALGEMVRVLLVELVDRSHVVMHDEMIL